MLASWRLWYLILIKSNKMKEHSNKCMKHSMSEKMELVTMYNIHVFISNYILTEFTLYCSFVTRSLVLCVCFVDRCLSFCTFSFSHCVFCSSSIYGFWLPFWYLQTLLDFTSPPFLLPGKVEGQWPLTYCLF